MDRMQKMQEDELSPGSEVERQLNGTYLRGSRQGRQDRQGRQAELDSFETHLLLWLFWLCDLCDLCESFLNAGRGEAKDVK